MNDEKIHIMAQYDRYVRIGAFALGFAAMILAGMLFGGCGGDIPTLPTLVFADDGGVDGGQP